MSLSKSVVLKLVLGDEIRKVTDLPENLAALRRVLHGLFGSADFQIKYLDEEQDLLTIATDEELSLAYQSTTGPSLKLILSPALRQPDSSQPKSDIQDDSPKKASDTADFRKAQNSCIFKNIKKGISNMFRKGKKELSKVTLREQFIQQLVRQEVSRMMGLPLTPVHDHVKCNGCSVTPITGVRFKCTQCPNFDFCELCEATTDHPHPFLKITNPVSSFSSTGVKEEAGLKMELVAPQWSEEDNLTPGDNIFRSWLVKNTGAESWPKGTRLVYLRGDAFGETTEVAAAVPQEEVIIGTLVTVPSYEGKCKGSFQLVTPKGVAFGSELTLELKVVREADQTTKVALLESMGFTDRDAIVRVLEACHGNVDQAAQQLSQ